MFTVDAVLESLALVNLSPDRYRAENVQGASKVVFGGQLLAQSLVAGLIGQEGKTAKTLHTVFARGARPDAPLDVSVDRIHAGRSMASSRVTISQGDRVCTQSLLLMSADEPDFISHAGTLETEPPPSDSGASDAAPGTWQMQVVGGVDVSDPEAVGPAELEVWTRWPDAPADDLTTNQALLAFSTDSFLIATAMRPHRGVGQAQAHVTVSTGVLSHTITFHEPCAASNWLLLAHRSPYAGRGRSYGKGDVYREDGGLVASFVQDAMIRPMAVPGANHL